MATRYYLTPKQVRVVKRACRYMKLRWQPECARPVTARKLVELVEKHGLEQGCLMWADYLAHRDELEAQSDEQWERTRNPEFPPSPFE